MNDKTNSNTNSLPIIFALSVVIGLTYSFLVYLIKWDLFLIFPALSAGILVFAMAKLGFGKKSKNTIGVLGLLIALATYYVGNGYFLQKYVLDEMEDSSTELGFEIDRSESQDFLDQYLEEKTGQSGLTGAILFNLKSTSISSSPGIDDEGLGVGYFGGIAILIIQIFIGMSVIKKSDENKLSKSMTKSKMDGSEKLSIRPDLKSDENKSS